ncbi:MAG: tRNA (N6-isopentenyl adenosine(37)-C2)-methylthiotransferase MiaB [Alphaproteobacteria bacterium]|nr:tRNA (N6-isopentenyl adenosine(37)-C2)-methylthiotransferase MiaB [Alphaproteobacteria bacterium]
MKKVYVKTFGCQMNVYDSVRMLDLLKNLGYEETLILDDADMVIFNTCHIREKASEKIFSELGKYKELKLDRKKQNKSFVIIVAGCVVQAESEEFLNRAKFVDIAIGPQSYHRLPQMLFELQKKNKKRIIDVEFPAVPKFDSLPETKSRGVSSFLAIQEGCDRFCSYCVVPYTRGAEYSRLRDDIMREAYQLAESGTKELVLLGQNVNTWCEKDASGKIKKNLADLIEDLSQIDEIKRIRYVTSYPSDFSVDLMNMHKNNKKVMPYLHLPIQSGSDAILKAMNRKYTVSQYEDIILNLREKCPDIALSSDFIVGFPGETETDFDKTLSLVKRVEYAQSYSFMYSPRPGTPAAVLANQIPEKIKGERLEILQKLLLEQHSNFNKKFVGQCVEVLVEEKAKKKSELLGHSPHMQNVVVSADPKYIGSFISVKIVSAGATTLVGKLENNF